MLVPWRAKGKSMIEILIWLPLFVDIFKCSENWCFGMIASFEENKRSGKGYYCLGRFCYPKWFKWYPPEVQQLAPEKLPKPNRKGSSSLPVFSGELLNFRGVDMKRTPPQHGWLWLLVADSVESSRWFTIADHCGNSHERWFGCHMKLCQLPKRIQVLNFFGIPPSTSVFVIVY